MLKTVETSAEWSVITLQFDPKQPGVELIVISLRYNTVWEAENWVAYRAFSKQKQNFESLGCTHNIVWELQRTEAHIVPSRIPPTQHFYMSGSY